MRFAGTLFPLRINRRWGNKPALGKFESLVRKPMPPGQDIRLERRCRFWDGHEKMPKLRSVGIQ